MILLATHLHPGQRKCTCVHSHRIWWCVMHGQNAAPESEYLHLPPTLWWQVVMCILQIGLQLILVECQEIVLQIGEICQCAGRCMKIVTTPHDHHRDHHHPLTQTCTNCEYHDSCGVILSSGWSLLLASAVFGSI